MFWRDAKSSAPPAEARAALAATANSSGLSANAQPAYQAASSIAVAGSSPSSGTAASTRPHSWATSIASKALSPAPPWSSLTSNPGQPASTAVGQRSGSSPPSSASRAASTVLWRLSALRAASRRNSCSSESARFIARTCFRGRRVRSSSYDALSCGRGLLLLGAQLGEGDALVEPRLRRQAQDPLADRVAQDLLGPSRRLEAWQERDHVRPLAVLGEGVGAQDVGDELAGGDRRVDGRDLGQAGLGARDLSALERGERAVAREPDREQLDADLAEALSHVGVRAGGLVARDRLREAPLAVAEALRAEPDRQALEHERRERRAPAAVDRAADRVGVQAHVVEEHLVELRLAGDLAQAANGDARRVHRDDEHRQALVLVGVGVRARQEQAVGGELRVGRPHLLAVEDPAAVLLLPGTGLHRREVRAGGRLG